jgi:hypothetical protein
MMSRLDDIVTITIPCERDTYRPKVLIAFDQDKFIERIKKLGELYLEENKIFAICFDVTPIDQLETMKNYKEVIDQFPKSNRIPSKAFYIGNIRKEDQISVAKKIVGTWLGDNYELVEIIQEST